MGKVGGQCHWFAPFQMKYYIKKTKFITSLRFFLVAATGIEPVTS